MKLYVVRHGITDWNEKGLVQGTSDILLNKNGLDMVTKSKEQLKDVDFDICISSPLKRAVQTAQIITDNKCKIIYDDSLIERKMGEFEGKHYTDYKNLDYWDYKSNNSNHKVEPVKDILLRAKCFLDKIKKENYDKVLIVSHAATIRAIHYNILGYDEDTNFISFQPENAKVYEYEI